MILRRLIHLSSRTRTWFLRGPVWLREPEFVVLISKVYRSAAVILFFWAMAWYERIFSRPARLMIVFFLICSFFCSVSVRNPALILLFLMIAATLTDFICGWIFRPKLVLQRHLPARVTCNVPFMVTYHIRNLRKHLPACDLLPEPYGEGKFVDRPSGLQYLSIRAGQEAGAEIRFQALRRGPLTFPCCMAESVFPFNIFKHAVRTGSRETILVRPYHKVMRSLHSGTGVLQKKRAVSTVPMAGESMDFHGCRNFRYGDPIRKIHWRLSAKHNTLIVKEFQQEQQARSAVLADVYFPSILRQFSLREVSFMLFRKDIFRSDDPVFEAILSLAASVTATLAANGYFVTRSTVSGAWRSLPAERGVEQTFLDDLSYAKKVLHDPLPGLTTSLAEFLPELENVFVILRRYDAPAKKLRLLLEDHHIPAQIFLVSADPPPADLPQSISCYTPDEILRGEVDSL